MNTRDLVAVLLCCLLGALALVIIVLNWGNLTALFS
jgi:hypothetical protein